MYCFKNYATIVTCSWRAPYTLLMDVKLWATVTDVVWQIKSFLSSKKKKKKEKLNDLLTKNFSKWSNWLYLVIVSHSCLRVNPHSVVAWMSRNLLDTGAISEESLYSHFIFRCRACIEQGVPWHSGNCRKWIHSEMRAWHNKNIQLRATYR